MKVINSLFFIGLIILLSCSKDGINGKNSIIDILQEPPGENCLNGGIKVISGIDVNENNILEENEIQDEEYLCNGLQGTNGLNSLVDIITEESGENCPNGGYIINSGLDLNSNSILEEIEVQSSVFVCNGLNGESDIQIRLSLLTILGTNTHGNAGAANGFFIGILENFNKNYWPGVDSIVFVTNLQTANNQSLASADLFNLDDNTMILNSTVSTRNSVSTKLVSENIYNYLPNEEIDLTIQLRSEFSQYQAMLTGKSYLLLYRRER